MGGGVHCRCGAGVGPEPRRICGSSPASSIVRSIKPLGKGRPHCAFKRPWVRPKRKVRFSVSIPKGAAARPLLRRLSLESCLCRRFLGSRVLPKDQVNFLDFRGVIGNVVMPLMVTNNLPILISFLSLASGCVMSVPEFEVVLLYIEEF
jgi:hypothetical protein